MKRKSMVFLIIILFSTGLFSETSYRKGELILHLNSPITIESNGNGFIQTNNNRINEISERYGFQKMYKIRVRNISGTDYFYHIGFDTTQNLKEMINNFRQLPNVLSVEPNYLFELHSNDTYFANQWALSKIDAEDAWTIEPGSSSITVAVLDCGVDLIQDVGQIYDPHPDLEDNLLFVNTRWGVNLISPGDQPIDIKGHGTHVIGIIGAVTNNNTGIAGLADIKILNVQITDSGSIDMETASIGIDTAVALGANVINMSFGKTYYDDEFGYFEGYDLLETSIENAYTDGVVLVASLGNGGSDYSTKADSLQMYPAYFSEVISVCATDSNDYKPSYSNYASWVDIAAPGGAGSPLSGDDVYSTTPRYNVLFDNYYNNWTHNYGYLCGTSMAAPYVSGLAALVLSYEPTIPAAIVCNIIKQTADNIDAINAGESWEGKLGAGRINAYTALQLLQNTPSTPSGFTSSSSGGHPKVYWNKNIEADLKEYKVKRILWNWVGPPTLWETLTSYFTTTDTFYQDNSFSIGSDRDRAYYSVCAVDYCSNYSNYTSSVMYQGTSPLWKPAFVDQDTVVYSIPNLDGRVEGDVFESNNYWTVADLITLICGDFEDDMSVGVSYRSYLSFDISFIENSDVITDAKLIAYQSYSIGNFVEGRYPILKLDGDTTYCTVSHICIGDSLKPQHWTAGDEGDSLTLESNIGYISTTPEIGFRELDVTQQIQNDIDNNRQYCQYRLAFPIRSDNDHKWDHLMFYSSNSENQQYWPRLEIHYQTTKAYQEPINETPIEFCLLPNYPNPFNAITTIRYEISETSPVILSIYDINGRLIKVLENTLRQPGKYSIEWNAANFSSGLYLIRIQAGSFQQVRKCLLVK